MTDPAPVMVEIAPGELIDKITILEIKADRIIEPLKLANVVVELDTLVATSAAALPSSDHLDVLRTQLKTVNEILWQIEDDIRECERAGDFGDTFVALARAVYQTNDKRAALKRDINRLLGSRLVEEKSYKPY